MSQEAYLVSVDDPNERITFQYVPSIAISNMAKLIANDQPFRNNPRQDHVGSNETLDVEMEFSGMANTQEVVQRAIEQIRAWTMVGSPRLILVMGTMFEPYTYRLKSSNSTPDGFFRDWDYLPSRGTIKIKLVVDTINNLTSSDVKRT